VPDLVVFLDLPVDVALTRGSFGSERYEKEAFQRKVAEKFATMQASSDWAVVDATEAQDEIAARIQDLALKAIDNVSSKKLPLREDLWV